MTVGAIALYAAGILLLVGYARRGSGALDRRHWSGVRAVGVVLAAVVLLAAGTVRVVGAVRTGAIPPSTLLAVALGVVLATATVRRLWDVVFLAVFK